MADQNNDVVVAKEPAPEVDLAAKLAETEAKLKKVSEDRDNYRKVALSKKGRADGDGGETEEERVERIVQEKLHDSQIGELLREKEEITRRALQENNELKVALKNRAQVGAGAAGASQDAPEVKTDFWTAEQKAELQRRYNNLPVGTRVSFEKYLETAKANYLKTKQS